MVAEHQHDATMVVARRSSEEEQTNMEIDTAARRRRSEEERWYGAEKVTYDVYTTLGVLRGYYEADDRGHEAAGEYQWDDRSGGDADKDVQGEAISKYSWSDGKKTVSIYIELDGLDDVAEEAFRAGGWRYRRFHHHRFGCWQAEDVQDSRVSRTRSLASRLHRRRESN